VGLASLDPPYNFSIKETNMMRRLFLLIAAVLFGVALIFATMPFAPPGNANGYAGASAGFAIAAELVLLVTALVKPDVGNGD
jgi:hypothetical protein